MSKQVIKELPSLVNAKVITEEDAERIRGYYASRPSQSHNRLLVVFGILGALLVGLGIILIVAHNWDELSKGAKTFFAFLPLVVGQVICGYTLLKRKDSAAWRESSSVFLFFAVGSSIALVAQIYHLPDDLAQFLTTWALLVLPLFYVMRSSIASMLYICVVTWLICERGYFNNWSNTGGVHLFHWLLYLAALPYYYILYRTKPNSNYFVLHSWLIALSLITTVGAMSSYNEGYLDLAYICLFSLLCITGRTTFFREQPIMANAYLIAGSVGMLVQLLIFSFSDAWIFRDLGLFPDVMPIYTTELQITIAMGLLALAAFIISVKIKGIAATHPSEYMFLFYGIAFAVSSSSEGSAAIIINMLLLGMGLYTVWQGAKSDHLGILNFGLIIITLQVVCRFFDEELSFVLRGILFLLVGAGFFVGNYLILKRRKETEAGK